MRLNVYHAVVFGAAIFIVLLVSYAIADPGHGRALGHSKSELVSPGRMVSTDPVWGTSAPAGSKNSVDFFVSPQKSQETQAAASQTMRPKNESASQLLNSTVTNSNTTAGAGSATTTSKPTGVIDAATQKPDWVANASSGHGPKPKPSPIPSATPGGTQSSPSPIPSVTPGTQSSPIPKPAGTPYPVDIPDVFPSGTPEGHIMPPGQAPVPELTPSQPSINPPPDI